MAPPGLQGSSPPISSATAPGSAQRANNTLENAVQGQRHSECLEFMAFGGMAGASFGMVLSAATVATTPAFIGCAVGFGLLGSVLGICFEHHTMPAEDDSPAPSSAELAPLFEV